MFASYTFCFGIKIVYYMNLLFKLKSDPKPQTFFKCMFSTLQVRDRECKECYILMEACHASMFLCM